MSQLRAVIFVNGSLPDPSAVRDLLHPEDALIAADGGTRHLRTLGLQPQVVIGDLDSTPAELSARLEKQGAHLLRFPRDKEQTDLELALRYAVDQGYKKLLLVAALGGRVDQTLGNLSLLADPALAELDVRLEDGVEEVFFVRRKAHVQGHPREVVSLIPWGGPVEGVRTEGLRWELQREMLSPYKTRGISNELVGDRAAISLVSGLLLIVHRRGTQTGLDRSIDS